MAHTKALGSTRWGRESAAKRLGVKRQNGQMVAAGEVLIRQRGTSYIPGQNVRRGGDDTLFAMKKGRVAFYKQTKVGFDGTKRKATFVKVV